MGNDVTDGVLFGARSLVLIRQPKYMSSCVKDLINISIIDNKTFYTLPKIYNNKQFL